MTVKFCILVTRKSEDCKSTYSINHLFGISKGLSGDGDWSQEERATATSSPLGRKRKTKKEAAYSLQLENQRCT